VIAVVNDKCNNFIEYYLAEYGQTIFFDAVKELNTNEILIETQFPFLTSATLEARNFPTIKETLKTFGYENPERLTLYGCEVDGFGWIAAICILGGIFINLSEVKKEVRGYFALKQLQNVPEND
jgi:hypothetical protein